MKIVSKEKRVKNVLSNADLGFLTIRGGMTIITGGSGRTKMEKKMIGDKKKQKEQKQDCQVDAGEAQSDSQQG